MTSRIDIIGSNGGDGEHYRLLPNCYGDYKGRFDCTNCEWLLRCQEATADAYKISNVVEKHINDNMARIQPATN